MSIGNDLNRTLAQFTSQMYDYVFDEKESMKKREDKKRKSASIFSITKREQDMDSRIHLLPLAIDKKAQSTIP